MRPLENGKWDPLEALPAQEGQAYRWFAVPVRLGLWEATAQVWLPQGMQQAVAGTPWEPKDLVKCAAALGKPGQAEELWSQLLQALAPALQDGELAPELTDAVVEEALGGDIRAVTALLARQPAIGHGIFGQCATAGRLCGAILLDCLAAGRWEQAAALLEEYRQGTQNPPRLPPEELLRALMEQCRRRGLLAAEAAQVLRQAIARLPEPVRRPLYGFHRKVFGAAPLEKPPLPPEPPAAQLQRSRPGREVMQMIIDRQMQTYCAARPRRRGALFLELVLLEKPARTGEGAVALPLWDKAGNVIGSLPLERLPPHPRTMVGRMIQGGQQVAASIDGELTLASAGLFCAALWWVRR